MAVGMNPKTLLLALVAPFCWGTGLAMAKPAVTHFPPLFMMLLVYSAIAVIMLITVRERIKTPWRSLLLISAFSVTIQGAFVFWGLRGVEATTANLVLQTQVPMAVFLGWLVAGEELNLRKILGTMIALVGVAIVIGLPEQRPALLPVTLIILGGFFWAFGQVLARKLSQDSGIMLLKANALMGIPQLILATAIFETGPVAVHHLGGINRMGNPGLCGLRRFLPRLYRLVLAAPPLPHGRGRTLRAADDAHRPSHRGHCFGRENVRRAIARGGGPVARLGNRQWLSHAEAETGLALRRRRG